MPGQDLLLHAQAPHRQHRAQPPCAAHSQLTHRLRQPKRHRWCMHATDTESETATSSTPTLDERDELQEQMEEFLRQQAESESGQVPLAESEDAPVTGTAEVAEEEALSMCKRISDIVRTLRTKRDMSLNEIRLTLAIEDPVAKERREYLELTDGTGASRDEIAAALSTVSAGKVPKDRIALKALHEEMLNWPFLNDEETLEKGQTSSYASITNTGEEPAPGRALPKLMKRDKNEAAKNVLDLLPDWVGYGALYAFSAIPVIIFGGVVILLFVTSLK